MNTELFKTLYNRLNPAQKTAVDTIEGPVMVVAGPGTGKTQVLTLRIANILASTQINPENILALTFTESAVYEMRNRLVSIIGTPAYRVQISTFHGFANDIIQSHSEEFGALISSESITDLDQIRIIETIIDSGSFKLLRPAGDPAFYLSHILKAINDLKKEGVDPIVFTYALDRQEADFALIDDLYHEKGAHKGKMKGKYTDQRKRLDKNKELAIVYTKYQSELRNRHEYDFNDMLLETIHVLEHNEELLLQIQEKYQYVLVDEHQDTNSAQNKIVELLSSFYAPNPNLFVVGDEKQAIFRFQGASLENFLYFRELYQSAVLINLQENYRSSQTILNAAGSLIGYNNRANKITPPNADLIAKAGHTEQTIKIAPFSEYYAEYQYLADDIAKKIGTGVAPREFAVLARNNRDLSPLADILDQRGIPYAVEADQNALQDIEIIKLLTMFRAINQLGIDAEFVRAMHIDCLDIQPLDIYRLVEFARQSRKTVWEVLAHETYSGQLEFINPEPLIRFFTQVTEWNTLAANTRFDDLFVKVLHDSCFLQTILKKKNATELIDKVTALFEDVRFQINRNRQFALHDFLNYIELLNQHNLSLRNANKSVKRNAVNLMTTHKSKGLEFDYVYIINVFDGHWGNARKRPSMFTLPWEYLTVKLDTVLEDDRNEDERRLFYVAITRARKQVVISYARLGLDGKEQVASQFIEEIALPFQEVIDTSAFEADFAAHKEAILQPRKTVEPGKVKDVYLSNTDYFAELFRRKGLAVSGLNNYLNCPWRYFFRNLLGLPEVKSIHQMFGTAVHEALNAYIRQLDTKKPTVQYLLERFEQALQKQPMSNEDYARSLERGKEMLAGYYEYAAGSFQSGMLSELDIRGIRFEEDIFLNGKLDMVEPLEGSSDVLVYDFKTGKPKTRGEIEGKTKGSTADYKRQLVFYKILLDRYMSGKMKMKEGILAFVQPDSKGQYRSEAFAIDAEEIKLLEETIVIVAKEIKTFAFWERRCDDPKCEYCRLRSFIEA